MDCDRGRRWSNMDWFSLYELQVWQKEVNYFHFYKWVALISECEPYGAWFPDRFENEYICHVACLQLVFNYIKYCNVVDLHNQVWQYDLDLKKWIAQYGYFRQYTTMFGMTVIDLWKSISMRNSKTNQYSIPSPRLQIFLQ